MSSLTAGQYYALLCIGSLIFILLCGWGIHLTDTYFGGKK